MCDENYYAFIENCLRNGVNGWGATSTERWFIARLEAEAAYLNQKHGGALQFPEILVFEYRKGLPSLTGQDQEAYQSAIQSGGDALDRWARERSRQPPPGA